MVSNEWLFCFPPTLNKMSLWCECDGLATKHMTKRQRLRWYIVFSAERNNGYETQPSVTKSNLLLTTSDTCHLHFITQLLVLFWCMIRWKYFVSDALAVLAQEIVPHSHATSSSKEYRISLALGLFYKVPNSIYMPNKSSEFLWLQIAKRHTMRTCVDENYSLE